MPFDLGHLFGIAGKIALVTGGTRGIGRSLAEAFVRNGVRTYLTGRNADDAERVARELGSYGDAIGLAADLAAVAGARALGTEIACREGSLHILVNNAGVFKASAIADVTEEQFDGDFGLNTRAPFFLAQTLLPLLRNAATANDPARIINMASGAGQFVGQEGISTYGASKAALIHLTQSMAAELAKDRITVNAVTPGVVVTEVSRGYTAQFGDVLFASIPTKRFTTPEEIAGSVIFLCGTAAANTTGQTLCADGGQTVMPVIRP